MSTRVCDRRYYAICENIDGDWYDSEADVYYEIIGEHDPRLNLSTESISTPCGQQRVKLCLGESAAAVAAINGLTAVNSGGSGAISVLTDNADGTYNHNDGDGTSVNIETRRGTVVDNGDGTFTITDDFGTVIVIDGDAETITTFSDQNMGGIAIGTYNSEDGTTYILREHLTTLSYNPTTNILSYFDEGGTNIDITLDSSVITDTIAGNRIATHTAADGTAVEIDETVTTLVDNGDGTFTFTNEAGATSVIDLNVITSVVSTLVNNGNGTFTYTNELGATTIFNANGTMVDNGDGTYTYTSPSGTVTVIDTSETVSSLVDNADGTFTYTNESGSPTVFNAKGTLVDNGNGTFTFTAADGAVTLFETRRTVISDNGNGSWNFQDDYGNSTIFASGSMATAQNMEEETAGNLLIRAAGPDGLGHFINSKPVEWTLRVGIDSETAGDGTTSVGYGAGQGSSSSMESTYVGGVAGSSASGDQQTVVGYNAFVSGSGTGNVVLGAYAGTSNDSNNNVFIGTSTSNNNTGGTGESVVIGAQAHQNGGAGSTNASSSVIIGYQAMLSGVATGAVVIGYKAYSSTSLGSGTVVIIGYQAAQSASGLTGCVVIGYEAGKASNADFSTLVGHQAGESNSGAAEITAVGYFAAKNNTATRVVAIGNNAAENNSNTISTFVGEESGQNASGDRVTAIGSQSAQNGDYSSSELVGFAAGGGATVDLTECQVMGQQAARNAATIFYSTIIGSRACDTVLGAPSNSIAIGRYTLREFNSSEGTYVGVYSGNYAVGSSGAYLGYTAGRYQQGNYQVGIGRAALEHASGVGNIGIGYLAGTTLSGNYNIAIGYSNTATASASATSVTGIDLDAGDSFTTTLPTAAGNTVDRVRITVTGHPFGSPGDYVTLEASSTGSMPASFSSGGPLPVEIIDANTLQINRNSTVLGSGILTLSLSTTDYDNTICIGYNTNCTASNQAVIGGSGISELRTGAGFFTLRGSTYAPSSSADETGIPAQIVTDSEPCMWINGSFLYVYNPSLSAGSRVVRTALSTF